MTINTQINAGLMEVVVLLLMMLQMLAEGCKTVDWLPEKAGTYLRNHTIQTLTTQSQDMCRVTCYLNDLCLSVNFHESTGTCDINDSDEYQHPGDVITRSGYKYRGTQNGCRSSPCPSNGTCLSDFTIKGGFKCVCPDWFTGPHCNTVYDDCMALRTDGFTTDGVYPIDPDGQGSFPVYCDMTTDGGGWTVFQKRFDGSADFNRGWQDYKTGFGNLTGEFWLGLDKIHRLTKRQVTSLRVDLEDVYGNTGHAVYSSFFIADESDFYRLNVSGYSGTAGDSITTADDQAWINNNMRFSTPDKDNDNDAAGACASKGGWWYAWCTNSDLNGNKAWWTFSEALRKTEMKLR